MEILMLVLLYYFSQNPNFAESVKPLMEQIKDSEQMLRFLKDLSNFTQTFSAFKQDPPCGQQTDKTETSSTHTQTESSQKENPQSPTSGIADEFIQSILDSYFKKSDNS